MKILGWITIALALIETVFLRIVGINMTEGQLLITFWPAWLTIVGLFFLGAWLLREKG